MTEVPAAARSGGGHPVQLSARHCEEKTQPPALLL
jgi:hypothetical protein